MELLIASNNAGKVQEIKAYLQSLDLKIYSLKEWQDLKQLSGAVPNPEETGLTYEENAFIKAKTCYEWSGIPCLADDTGLEVEALDKRPGLYSARYAGEHATFADNIAKMQSELHGVINRQAKFKACLIYFDGAQKEIFNGEISGDILATQQGTGGFGYDPIFKPSTRSLTFAELKVTEPDFPTHRIQALIKFREFLLASKLRKEQ